MERLTEAIEKQERRMLKALWKPLVNSNYNEANNFQ